MLSPHAAAPGRRVLLAGGLLACLAACAAAADSRKVVIPFDFESKFDDGRYGRMVGDMIWKKLERERGFIIPETMLDVRQFCTRNKLNLSAGTSLDEMKRVVVEEFGAHIGIWGSVERAPGAQWEVYDLVVKCVDFSGDAPKVIYDRSARTNSVSEIPHLYVKEMFDKLYDRQPDGPPPIDVFAEENWEKNPNLVKGGDFQQGARGVPTGWAPGWEAGDVNQWEPLGRTVSWIPEAGNPTNRVIRFTFDAGLGDSTGVAYYSDFFPIEEAAKYRFQCRWRSTGPKVIVFIKCYAEVDTQYRTAGEQPSGHARMTRKDYIPEASQVREVYRSQQNLKGPLKTWNTQTEDFTPRHTRYEPKWGRVMLYSYLGGGVVEFDDVVVKQIVPASASDRMKTPRHSIETQVTIEEMEEAERRSREARQK
jgi:hypothetical protein